MTEIKIRREADMIRIEISGHSLYAPKGTDIVCAAISSLMISFNSYIDKKYGARVVKDVRQSDGYMYEDIELADERLYGAADMLCEGFLKIAELYPGNVRVEESGVWSCMNA